MFQLTLYKVVLTGVDREVMQYKKERTWKTVPPRFPIFPLRLWSVDKALSRNTPLQILNLTGKYSRRNDPVGWSWQNVICRPKRKRRKQFVKKKRKNLNSGFNFPHWVFKYYFPIWPFICMQGFGLIFTARLRSINAILLLNKLKCYIYFWNIFNDIWIK